MWSGGKPTPQWRRKRKAFAERELFRVPTPLSIGDDLDPTHKNLKWVTRERKRHLPHLPHLPHHVSPYATRPN
jgi:hypothetical protein